MLGKPIYAHSAPTPLVGNHDFSGPVGMDFKVNRSIKISRLGVFDSGGDGLKRSITVSLWHIQEQKRYSVAVFTPDRPGELIGTFRYLDVPVVTVPKVICALWAQRRNGFWFSPRRLLHDTAPSAINSRLSHTGLSTAFSRADPGSSVDHSGRKLWP